MKKKFNDTGLCVPSKHYMVDTTYQLGKTIELIEEGEYFIINRPRQFGKTTILHLLENNLLLKDSIVISIDFEDVEKEIFENVVTFIKMFIDKIKDELEFKNIKLNDESIFYYDEQSTLNSLSKVITALIKNIDKNVILIIDEVDKISNNELFLNFLGLLRSKYLSAKKGKTSTFHSVILAGLHDVKNIKLKLLPDEETTYNSPWNIAVSYDVDMTFKPKQIESMLVDYINATKQNDNKRDSLPKMDIAKIAEKLYYYTSGYPYFVSKLCKIIDEKIKPKEWSEKDIQQAIKILLDEKYNANFDTIIKRLEENKDLYATTKKVLLGSKSFTYNLRIPIVTLGSIHGIFKQNQTGYLAVFNKIYEEMIMDYMLGKIELEDDTDVVQSQFLKDNGKLDLKKLLTKFKDAIEEKYSSSEHLKSKEFLEDDLRMQFFMYLKPVLNSVGFCCKEVQTSEERRMDVLIFFRDEKFIIELKIWKGEKLHKDGIAQIKDYMRREHVDKGYMIIMNKNKTKEFKTTDENGLFTAWV